jgi:hypothetical protein
MKNIILLLLKLFSFWLKKNNKKVQIKPKFVAELMARMTVDEKMDN